MEDQSQNPQDNKPAQEAAAPNSNAPAQAITIPSHPMPTPANGFDMTLQAGPMDQVLPDALQEVIPGGMPEILPGMLPTGEMFMPQLLPSDAQQLLANAGALPSIPAEAMSAGMGRPLFVVVQAD